MVATSLPFWMQQPGRSMSPFSADSAMRLGVSVAPAERRTAPGAVLRAGRVPGLYAEICDPAAVGAYEEAWAALAVRALEPNAFLEPGFVLPALRHFPPSQRPTFLLVWRGDEAGRADLVGLCALRPRQSAYGRAMSLAWTHEQATLSAPLLDRERAGDVLDLMLDVLARQSSDWSGLLCQGVAVDGPLARLVEERGLQAVKVETRSRTVLRRGDEAGAARREADVGAKQAKELRRQRRRLADEGGCVYRSASTPDEVRAATEQFLHLEARGWKGRRGTALLNDAGLAAFTRAMTRQLARAGLCRIDSLEVAGQPVAMGIVLRSADRAFFWKTTYDEGMRRLSPGKQLADAMRAVQLADPTLAMTDSCAVADHSMIGHVWSDTMVVGDLLVAGPAVAPAALQRTARVVAAVRRSRSAAKSAYLFLRRVMLSGRP